MGPRSCLAISRLCFIFLRGRELRTELPGCFRFWPKPLPSEGPILSASLKSLFWSSMIDWMWKSTSFTSLRRTPWMGRTLLSTCIEANCENLLWKSCNGQRCESHLQVFQAVRVGELLLLEEQQQPVENPLEGSHLVVQLAEVEVRLHRAAVPSLLALPGGPVDLVQDVPELVEGGVSERRQPTLR